MRRVYDFISYSDQLEQRRRANAGQDGRAAFRTRDEFLSGFRKGTQGGILQGISSGTVRIVKTLMVSQGIPVEQAMDMIAIPPEDRARYAELVAQ